MIILALLWFVFGIAGALKFWRDYCKAYGHETIWQWNFLFYTFCGVLGFFVSFFDAKNTRERGRIFRERMSKLE